MENVPWGDCNNHRQSTSLSLDLSFPFIQALLMIADWQCLRGLHDKDKLQGVSFLYSFSNYSSLPWIQIYNRSPCYLCSKHFTDPSGLPVIWWPEDLIDSKSIQLTLLLQLTVKIGASKLPSEHRALRPPSWLAHQLVNTCHSTIEPLQWHKIICISLCH